MSVLVSDYLLSLVSKYSCLPLPSSEDNEEFGQLVFCGILEEVRRGRTEVLGSQNLLDVLFFCLKYEGMYYGAGFFIASVLEMGKRCYGERLSNLPEEIQLIKVELDF